MARQPCIEFAGAFYHVMCRGDRREPIFEDDEDRRTFLRSLTECCEKRGWRPSESRSRRHGGPSRRQAVNDPAWKDGRTLVKNC